MPIKGFEKDIMAAIGAYDDPEDTPESIIGKTVNQTYDIDEVRLSAEGDLNFLAGMAIPDVFKYMFPPVLLAVWNILKEQEKQVRAFPQLALGIPRGHAKTTLIKLYVLYCILFTKRKFILIISNTESLAVNILSDIADMMNEPNIIAAFGDWKISLETNRSDLKKFGFRGRNIILAAVGAGGSLRGLNIKNQRPDIMIFEDIQSREEADSPDLCNKLETWMAGTAMKAKSPEGCFFIFVGNMYPSPYSLLRKLKTNPLWMKFISGAILDDGTTLWEELRPLKELIKEFQNDISLGHPELFFSEVLNDDTRGINNRVDFSALSTWKYTDTDRPDGKFIIIDPSSNKVGGDMVAIGFFEVYSGTPALREVIEEPLSPSMTIKRALILALENNCRTIVVESNSYQYTLLHWFDIISKQLGLEGFHFVEVYSGSYSKNSRISDLMKILTAGEIILHPTVKSDVAKQIADWSPMRRNNRDNILDLLTYAPKVMELYGSEILTEDFLTVEAVIAEGVRDNNHGF